MATDDASATILPASQCWALLRQSVVGRLAVVDDEGQPDIFPVNHVVDHAAVAFRTADGTKLARAINRKVAFEVDGYDTETRSAWSVVLKGAAREIWAVDDAIKALELPLTPWQQSAKPRLVRLEPTSVTGRRFVVAGGAGPA